MPLKEIKQHAKYIEETFSPVFISDFMEAMSQSMGSRISKHISADMSLNLER